MTSQFTKLTHHQHSGELEVQRFQGVPSSMPPELVSDEMPKQHSDFFSNLQYFAIGTTDSQGRPWSTILSSQTGFIHALSSTKLSISCLVAREDPFLRAVEEHEKQKGGKKLLFAGLGVDFTNRRRNKVAGVILKAQVTPSSPSLSRLEMILFTNENMGNCPKYITTRTLEYFPNDPNLESRTLSSNEVLLDSSCQDIISQASTVFLVTRHLGSPSLFTSFFSFFSSPSFFLFFSLSFFFPLTFSCRRRGRLHQRVRFGTQPQRRNAWFCTG